MNIKKEILFRVRIAFIIIAIVSIAIIYSIIDLQFNQGEYWESKSKDINLSYLKIKASRGNILSDDGSILATSLPFYKVAFDPSIISEELFINKVDSLSYLLSTFFSSKSTLFSSVKSMFIMCFLNSLFTNGFFWRSFSFFGGVSS